MSHDKSPRKPLAAFWISVMRRPEVLARMRSPLAIPTISL
jgi:hypothetical protein